MYRVKCACASGVVAKTAKHGNEGSVPYGKEEGKTWSSA